MGKEGSDKGTAAIARKPYPHVWKEQASQYSTATGNSTNSSPIPRKYSGKRPTTDKKDKKGSTKRGTDQSSARRKIMELVQQQTKFEQPAQAVVVQEDCIDFLQTLPPESVDIITTDPAYSGMNQKLNFGSGRIVGQYQKEGNGKWFKEFHDTEQNYRAFLSECRRILKDTAVIYIMFDSYSLLSLGSLVREYFEVKNIIVWDKVNMGMGHNFRRRHEFIIYATKGKSKLNSRSIPDIWQIKRITNANYPTQKPVEVFQTMLAASAQPGFIVCDPFVGSGSSAIAALKSGCQFIGADVSPKACKITRERIAEYLKTNTDPDQPKSLAVTQKLGYWM